LITLTQAIIMALFYGILKCGFAYSALVMIGNGCLPAALVAGIVMGDIPKALAVGATCQLMYLGVIAPGGQAPSSPSLAALFASAFVISANLSIEAATAVAVPVGLIGVQLGNVKNMLNSVWVNKADQYAEQADTKRMFLTGVIGPSVIALILFVPLVTVGLYFGASVVDSIFKAIPTWVMNGIKVVGGMLPALGFAIIVTIIGKKKFLPFFAAGYFLVAYTGVSIIPLTLLGLFLSYLYVTFTGDNKLQTGGETNG
jgi:PTS system mannose-specific IIC component